MNGEKTADCALARNGRPAITCGFHNGTSGARSRAYCVNGWNTATESASSGLEPNGRTPSGRIPSHGVAPHR